MRKTQILTPILAATLIAGMNFTATAKPRQTEIKIVAPPFIYQSPIKASARTAEMPAPPFICFRDNIYESSGATKTAQTTTAAPSFYLGASKY